MAAPTEAVQRDVSSDNSSDFDDLEQILLNSNEVGSGYICEECGNYIFTSAVICSNELCRGNSGDPATFHSSCMGVQNENLDAAILDKEWLCPRCSSCNNTLSDTTGQEGGSGSVDGNVNESNSRKRKDENQPSQQRKKVSVKRPAAVFTCNDVLVNIILYVSQILTSLKTHSTYSRSKYPNSQAIQNLGEKLTSNAGHSSFVNFWNWTAEKLWELITAGDNRVLNCQTNESIFTKFHIFRMKPAQEKWDQMLRELGLFRGANDKVSNVLLQYCLRLLKERIIKERNKADKPEDTSSDTSPLTPHDHQVINYIAGFVPFALVKKFSKVKSSTAEVFVKLLKSWELNDSNAESFVTYARDWLNKQNKGHLFKPSWDLHVFFRTLEYVGRKMLTSSRIGQYKDSNLQELLISTFEQNKTVITGWNNLVKDELNNEQNIKLLKIILHYWIKIRCNAYVRVYIDIRKAKDKSISRSGSKSLRKTVDKN